MELELRGVKCVLEVLTPAFNNAGCDSKIRPSAPLLVDDSWYAIVGIPAPRPQSR